MIYLERIQTKVDQTEQNSEYPYSLPVVEHLDEIVFENAVTFLVGENGSGKSTLLETIAVGLNMTSIGSNNQQQDHRYDGARKLSSRIKFVRKSHPRKGFFFRSEDFVGFVDRLNSEKQEMDELHDSYDKELSGYGRILATGMAKSQSEALSRRYGGDLHNSSHGEGFFKIFQSRLVPNGLYLIDEPEASLSPLRQLSLMTLINDMVNKNCQFIIASHSPILMAFPNASIYDVESNPIAVVDYDQCEHVSLTRDFLKSPELFLRHLTDTQD